MGNHRIAAIVAAGALIAVLALAGFGYATLSQRGTETSVSASTAEAKSQEEVARGDDTVLLADHDATVYTELGEPLPLSAIADGRPLVINFWATWCPYCVQELPDFQEIYREYADRVAFAFVDMADGSRETVEGAASWLAEQGFDDLPAYYDTSGEAAAEFGAWSLPTTAVVSGDGEVLAISAGVIDANRLRDALDTLV